jgi:xanthine/CO dehydrogenase XdhC/CoxF family maturation factor
MVTKIFSPEESIETLGLDDFSAVVLMSHDLAKDTFQLPRFLATDIPFIGMLGPKVRTEKILMELEKQGLPVTAAQKRRIHAPVGLDIGATTPEEIALSILAEIRADFSKRSAQPLRDRDRPIYAE